MYNNLKKLGAFVTITVLVLSMITVYAISESLDVEKQNTIDCMIQDSPPYPSTDISGNIVTKIPSTSKILNNVPTSTWTYGCSPTSAGMIFGFYDRTTHANMYTGPANGGVCPLTNLGQGIGSPISGSCYIIATQQGHDGITEKAHVDDYWISIGSSGHDPWEGSWPEHSWELCTADFMGTSQWKWDVDGDGVKDLCNDGSTGFVFWSDGSKCYDPIPPASCGLPQTAGCHGMKLFAQSRGYSVVTNFNQRTDNYHPNGFTFSEFKAEIDANRPVLINVEGHSMVGLGYDDSTTPETIYIHNTWDNSLHQMPWGGSYDGRVLKGVTVIRLHGGNSVPSVHITYPSDSATVSGEITIQGTASDSDGSISEVRARIVTGSWQTASDTTSWSFDWDTTAVNNGFHTISARSKDNNDDYSVIDSVGVNVDNTDNNPPYQPNNPRPSEHATDVDVNADVSWNGGDPNEGDTVSYDVYFGDVNPPPLEISDHLDTSYDPGIMDLSTTYYWCIIARDNHGATRIGPLWDFTTASEDINQPPNKPGKPSGTTNGNAGEEYTYETVTTDPDGDDIFYLFDWGNGMTSFILGPYESGAECSASNIWFEKGDYDIKVKAIDSYGAESDWSDPLSISMPRNRGVIRLFLQFLEQHPILYQLFQLFQRVLQL